MHIRESKVSSERIVSLKEEHTTFAPPSYHQHPPPNKMCSFRPTSSRTRSERNGRTFTPLLLYNAVGTRRERADTACQRSNNLINKKTPVNLFDITTLCPGKWNRPGSPIVAAVKQRSKKRELNKKVVISEDYACSWTQTN